jgi:hypothetical protein
MIRQGDVGLRSVNHTLSLAKAKVLDHLVLATGEITGHAHRVVAGVGGTARIVEDENGTWYLQVEGAPATIVHEEHQPLTVEPGIYQVIRQREYDDTEEWRRVQD